MSTTSTYLRAMAAVASLLAGGTAVAACGGAGGPSAAATSSTTHAPTTATSPPVLVVHDASGAVSFRGRRPTTIGFSVDATNVVGTLRWATWGPKTAVGHGVWAADNCDPDCASGKITDVPATITLSHVAGGHFTVMTERTEQHTRSYHYPGHWATSAS